jgi:ankyrin repeat protein
MRETSINKEKFVISVRSQETVLHYAVRRGDLHLVSLLVSRKLNINALGERGTAIDVAKSERKWDILALLNGRAGNFLFLM